MNSSSNNWASSFFEGRSIAEASVTQNLLNSTSCTYRDFSTYIEQGGTIEKHKKSDRNFPARLHAMLSDEQYSHIITWMVSSLYPDCVCYNLYKLPTDSMICFESTTATRPCLEGS